jgi:hypothetical protein
MAGPERSVRIRLTVPARFALIHQRIMRDPHRFGTRRRLESRLRPTNRETYQ